MSVNINTELFRKTKPETKLHMINNLTESELLSVRLDTIIRIIKEAGEGSSREARSHNKTLKLVNRVGNDWNADVNEVSIYKKVPYIGFTVYLDDTDPYDDDKLESFLRRGEYRGCYTYEDRYDRPQTDYYRFDEEDKAKVIREILSTYIHRKYNV